MLTASEVPDYTPSGYKNEAEEFNRRYNYVSDQQRAIDNALTLEDGRQVAWCAQKGSQESFLSATNIFEVLFHGTRGPGKTDALLMAFAMHTQKGYGGSWRGVIFRETYPQLADIQAKSEKWYPQIFGGAVKFNKTKMMWQWDTGEFLMFRHMSAISDYWNYHGHEFPFIGWEELTNWMTDDCYKSMISCCRSSNPDVPRMIRATTNPYGVGHNWIKERFQLSGQWWKTVVIMEPIDPLTKGREKPRAAIHGHINENLLLLKADPDYKRTVMSSATNAAMAAAWLHGSWDIAAGGIFSDVWNAEYNVIEPFKIPRGWRVFRAFDWGSSKPFSVGWWAVSDGSDYKDSKGKMRYSVKGDMFRIGEWYGWTGKANTGLKLLAREIAKGIVERELEMGIRTRVQPGPADSSIYDTENGVCIAVDMAQPIRLDDKTSHKGVNFVPADKRAGTRKSGWERIRKMMKAAHPTEDGIREEPGLFIQNNCLQFLRTMPTLPRDEIKMDDVDTDSEDHIADETRYAVQGAGVKTNPRGRARGLL